MEKSFTAAINPSNIKKRYDIAPTDKDKKIKYDNILRELVQSGTLGLNSEQAQEVLNKILGL